MKNNHTAKLFALGTVAVMAIVFLSTQAAAANKIEVKNSEIINSDIALSNGLYTSPIYKTDFKFNLAGYAWQGDSEVEVAIRLYDSQGWSEWYQPESASSLANNGWNIGIEPVMAAGASQLQYRLSSDERIDSFKIIYINTQTAPIKKWNIFNLLFSKAQAADPLNVISRAEWEADENWRLDSAGDELWPAEYQWPEKFVIHHTAGSDGTLDPKGTIRGVYYWHAVVLGWGDIGYNYLIDQAGNIYQGRSGGDGTIGAHVYRSRTCAEQRFGGGEYEADFNPGTIGIAVLGDYQTKLTLNDSVKHALANLIANQAKEYAINPSGESFFVDDNYANIVGHKDFDCTDCPGKNFYSQLEEIRASAQSVYEALGGDPEPVVKATLVGQSDQPAEVTAGQEKEVWVDFRNDGNFTWRNYTQNTLQVLAKSQASPLYVAGWDSPTQVAKLTTPNVAPGEVGRFIFTIKGPEDQLEVKEEFELQFGSQVLADTSFSITAQVVGLQYAGDLEDQSILPATFVKAGQAVTMIFKNRGLKTWRQGEVKLNIYDLGGAVSRFYDASWPSQYGQIDFEENEVGSGEFATFIYKLKSPAEPGLFLNSFKLMAEEDVVQSFDYFITRVDSIYQAVLVSHNVPLAVLSVWRLPAVLKFKNVGLAVWDQNVVLKVNDLGGQVSRFQGNDWLNYSTAAKLREKSVKNGEIGTFAFTFKSPSEKGLYLNNFKLVRGLASIEGSDFSLITRVDK